MARKATPGGPAWSPRFLLYFGAFGADLLGLDVDDRYLYWYQHDHHFMRALKSGEGRPELLIECGACDPYRFATDGGTGFVYFVAGSELLKVDRQGPGRTSIPLDADHRMGALLVTERYLYTALPGCSAITRIDKSTLVKDVMRVEGATFPSKPGSTKLTTAGDKLLCTSPDTLYAFGAWGEPPRRLAEGIGSLWGAATLRDQVFWLAGDRAPNSVSTLDISGRNPQTAAEKGLGPRTLELLAAPAIGKVVYGNGDGLQAYNPLRNALDRFVAVGHVRDLAVDSGFAYATIWGQRPHLVNGQARSDSAHWIVRVPLRELE